MLNFNLPKQGSTSEESFVVEIDFDQGPKVVVQNAHNAQELVEQYVQFFEQGNRLGVFSTLNGSKNKIKVYIYEPGMTVFGVEDALANPINIQLYMDISAEQFLEENTLYTITYNLSSAQVQSQSGRK